jgi:hypothetical protein
MHANVIVSGIFIFICIYLFIYLFIFGAVVADKNRSNFTIIASFNTPTQDKNVAPFLFGSHLP